MRWVADRESDVPSDPRVYGKTHQPPEFNASLSTDDDLNVTTRLAPMTKSSPVCGFRPLRFFLALTVHLPNPEIRTSLPLSRSSLMISKRLSTILTHSFLGMPS